MNVFLRDHGHDELMQLPSLPLSAIHDQHSNDPYTLFIREYATHLKISLDSQVDSRARTVEHIVDFFDCSFRKSRHRETPLSLLIWLPYALDGSSYETNRSAVQESYLSFMMSKTRSMTELMSGLGSASDISPSLATKVSRIALRHIFSRKLQPQGSS